MGWRSAMDALIIGLQKIANVRYPDAPPGLKCSRIIYTQEGREGRVHFRRGSLGFDMYFEFGGGDTIATLDVPSSDEWSERTGFPVEMRQAILEFIADRVVRDKVTPGRGSYEILERCIRIVERNPGSVT